MNKDLEIRITAMESRQDNLEIGFKNLLESCGMLLLRSKNTLDQIQADHKRHQDKINEIPMLVQQIVIQQSEALAFERSAYINDMHKAQDQCDKVHKIYAKISENNG